MQVCYLVSDMRVLGSMDKNIGEQLNKAFEAFRQACMDRDSAVKELKQKTESYEQQIREQQEQLLLQKNIIAKLKSQVAPVNANAGNIHVHAPVSEDSETGRNGTLNLTFDQLHEKLKFAMQREKLLKEQFKNESIKLRRIEEESSLRENKLESIIAVMEEKIRFLRNRLKEVSEAQNCIQMPRYEFEAKSEKTASTSQELSPEVTIHEREDLETVFWEMKEECHRVCALTRAQTDQLSKLNIRRDPVTEIQVSMPIQCTDKTDEQAEEVLKPWLKKDINRGTSCITPRGAGQDEEENSVESLSNFNVKFPPTDNDSAFLQSTQDTPVVPCPGIAEKVHRDHPFIELRDLAPNFGELNSSLLEAYRVDPITSAIQNLATINKTKPSSHANTLLQNAQDKTPCLKTADVYNFGATIFTNQDTPEENSPPSETAGRTVRGPQQPLWKPYHTQDNNDLLALPSTDSEQNQPGVCEFCQKVFPPSITSREDFLRHLNSHFKVHS
uniref:TRAF family member associated NFKB activator n=1 Tax=Sphenodon punctatus TaxID=8508 RepID=A0A8D0HD26_SPHPU